MNTKKMKYSKSEYAIAFLFSISVLINSITLFYMMMGIFSVHQKHKSMIITVFLVSGVICLFCFPFAKEILDKDIVRK